MCQIYSHFYVLHTGNLLKNCASCATHDLRQYYHATLRQCSPVDKSCDNIAGNRKMKSNVDAYISPTPGDDTVEPSSNGVPWTMILDLKFLFHKFQIVAEQTHRIGLWWDC